MRLTFFVAAVVAPAWLGACADFDRFRVVVDGGSDAGVSLDAGADGGTTARLVDLSTGGITTFAVSSTGSLYLWGNNSSNRFFAGDETYDAPVRVPAVTDVKEVSGGASHVCVITNSNTIRCWGNNRAGKLGDDSEVASSTPRQVTLNDVDSVHAGTDATCAIAGTDRQLYCWGDNQSGELGLGPGAETKILTPALVTGMSQVASVAMGTDHICARLLSGTVRCAGEGEGGRLGSGDADSDTFVDVPGFTNFSSVAASDEGACGALGGGEVVCWGRHFTTETTRSAFRTPFTVSGITDAVEVFSGPDADAFCAHNASGDASCWGNNGEGIGIASTVFSADALPLTGLPAVQKLAVGEDHGCALTTAGAAFCWGSNAFGQVGVASSDRMFDTPQAVALSE